MLFSLDFVVLFLPLTLLGFFAVRRCAPTLCPVYLVALLYVALYWLDSRSCALVLLTSTLNYWLIRRMVQSPRAKGLLSVGIVLALLPLVLFKFAPSVFVTASSDTRLFFTLGIPIGLSFYALQQVSALLDCRHGQYPLLSYPRHLLYLGFFPNFVAGPVLTYRDGVQQMAALGRKVIPDSWLGNGLLLFFFGLAKKLWIADPLGGAIDHIYANVHSKGISLDFYEAWFVVWGFLVQLYFDFSAYSDIAIGLALCFGVLLPINFDSPLKSFTTQAYIARWHMSFTQFVQTYLFIPVLGVLKKLPIKNTEKKMAFAWAGGLFLSYMVIGIWHSPNVSIMLSSVLAILVLFLLKVPRILEGHVAAPVSMTWGRQQINRLLILTFSMLMATSLKIQDVHVIMDVYAALVNVHDLSLPRGLQAILPTAVANGFVYEGVAPTLSSYHAGTFVFTHKQAYFLLLLVASIMIFGSPNSMVLFGIKGHDKQGDFKLGTGKRFYLIFSVLFFLVVFALLFENHHQAAFIYAYF